MDKSTMDSVCKELNEVKLELDKIKKEYGIKTELLENLRKANGDQAVRYQEVMFQMEKLAQELRTKEEERAESMHFYEDVKCRLQETESSLKHVRFINEKLRTDSGEKVQRLEEENRKLVSALDEATLKTNELESQLCACREEVAGLKVLVLDSQKKCSEAEQKIELKKALSNRDDVIMKLEEECVGIQDRLKWKTEQFEHLEEAHKLLQEHFQSSKQEWASEKATLLQEISSLQISVDTQVRLNENLQTELKMCNQALAHEESRRRALENQLSESKVCFDNVLGEFKEAKCKNENLSMERDEKVAALRNALGTKNAHVKEMEYKISHLEQDNKELIHSVKELQEAQIGRKKPDSSFIKLRNKLRDLEQTHNSCSMILEEREAEWNMKMESMIGQLTRCEFDLKTKTEEINQLKLQVESCQSSIDISGEEISILLMVLKSAYSEIYSKMLHLKLESDTQKEEVEEKLAVSDKQETESESQLKAQLHLEQAGEEIKSLSKKLEALKIVETKNTLLENELDKCRKMLDESSIRQVRLEEHAALMEASSKQMRDEVVDLQKEKAHLEEWKRRELLARSDVEKLKQEMEKLYMIAECKDQSTRDLQALVTTLEQNFMEASVSSFSETFEMLTKNGALREALDNAEYRITTEVDLQKEKAQLEKEWKKRDLLARSEVEKLKQEMEKLYMIAEGKDKSTRDLQALVTTLEQNFMDASASSFSETFEMLTKNGALKEALEKAEYLITTEVDLQKEKAQLEKEWKKRELLARSDVEKLKQEMEKLNMIAEGKDQSSRDLQALVTTLEQNFMDASVSSFSETFEMLTKNCALREALENAEYLITTEVDLQKEKAQLEKEWKRRELLARSDVEKLKQEMEKLYVIAEGKDQSTRDLHALVTTLEQNFMDASVSSFSETFEMLTKNGALREALENAEYLITTEVQEKKRLVSALEKELADTHSEVVHVEETLLHSQIRVKELEALVEHKALEMDSLKVDLGNVQAKYNEMEKEVKEKKSLVSALEKESADLCAKIIHVEESLLNSQYREKELEALLERDALEKYRLNDDLGNIQSKYKKAENELELTKQALTEDIRKLSSERECLVACIEGVYEQIGGFHEDDAKLMGMLDKMQSHYEEDGLKLTEGIIKGSDVCDQVKDDSFSNKGKVKGNLDRRVCPLRELN